VLVEYNAGYHIFYKAEHGLLKMGSSREDNRIFFLPVCFLSEKEVLLSVDLSYSCNDTQLKEILISIIQNIWQKKI
jgi:hypothetical protein